MNKKNGHMLGVYNYKELSLQIKKNLMKKFWVKKTRGYISKKSLR